MISLDEEFLSGLGLGDLSPDDQQSLLTAVYEQLEFSVGRRLVKCMSASERREFETLVDGGDEGQQLAWLQEHVPGYSQIVREALDEQMEELRQRRGEILEAVGVDVKE